MILIKQALSIVGLAVLTAMANASSVLAQDDEPRLLCHVQTLMMKMEINVREDMYYMCETTTGKEPYFLDLPSDFTTNHPELAVGNTFISISNATVVEEGDGHPASIAYPVGASISIVEPSSSRRLVVADQSSHKTLGVRRALVVRVTSLDSEVSLDQATLSARVFGIGDGAEEVNLVSQWRDCSAGQMQILPAEQEGVIDGVYEMFLPRNTSDSLGTYYTGMHNMLVEELGSDLRDRVDDIMICLPANANTRGRRFVAFALGGANFRSYYRDSYCGSLTAYMHEVGHHFGLQHAGRPGQGPYSDLTGYMGYAVSGTPPMCFNGGNHWYLNWFADRRVEVTPESSWTGKLAAFTDYTETTEGEHVVLMKVGDYYVQYNRAEKHNAGTQQERDRVTIVIRLSNGLTDLVASLDASSVTEESFFFVEDFEGSGHTMVFEACAMVNSAPDYILMNVYLANGEQNTLCGVQPSTFPSMSPMPSTTPTTGAPSVAPSASLMPTTGAPSTTPSTSIVPSMAPSTSAPSALPSSSPSGKCEDNADATFSVHYKSLRRSLPRTCIWLSRNKSWQPRVCHPQHEVYNVCPETCGACTDGCSDDAEFSIYVNAKVGEIDCYWLSRRPVLAERWCGLRLAIADACGETCNSCTTEEDSVLNWYNNLTP